MFLLRVTNVGGMNWTRALVWLAVVLASVIAIFRLVNPPEVKRLSVSLVKAEKLLQVGDFEDASVAYRIAATVDGDHPEVRWGMIKTSMLLAVEYIDLELAHHWVQGAIMDHPQDPYVFLFLADLKVRTNNHVAALKNYLLALSLEPDLIYARHRLGHLDTNVLESTSIISNTDQRN